MVRARYASLPSSYTSWEDGRRRAAQQARTGEKAS
jgi:hypothetical protein